MAYKFNQSIVLDPTRTTIDLENIKGFSLYIYEPLAPFTIITDGGTVNMYETISEAQTGTRVSFNFLSSVDQTRYLLLKFDDPDDLNFFSTTTKKTTLGTYASLYCPSSIDGQYVKHDLGSVIRSELFGYGNDEETNFVRLNVNPEISSSAIAGELSGIGTGSSGNIPDTSYSKLQTSSTGTLGKTYGIDGSVVLMVTEIEPVLEISPKKVFRVDDELTLDDLDIKLYNTYGEEAEFTVLDYYFSDGSRIAKLSDDNITVVVSPTSFSTEYNILGVCEIVVEKKIPEYTIPLLEIDIKDKLTTETLQLPTGFSFNEFVEFNEIKTFEVSATYSNGDPNYLDVTITIPVTVVREFKKTDGNKFLINSFKKGKKIRIYKNGSWVNVDLKIY